MLQGPTSRSSSSDKETSSGIPVAMNHVARQPSEPPNHPEQSEAAAAAAITPEAKAQSAQAAHQQAAHKMSGLKVLLPSPTTSRTSTFADRVVIDRLEEADDALGPRGPGARAGLA